ncbi:unnamed protein product [Caretta caretta]
MGPQSRERQNRLLPETEAQLTPPYSRLADSKLTVAAAESPDLSSSLYNHRGSGLHHGQPAFITDCTPNTLPPAEGSILGLDTCSDAVAHCSRMIAMEGLMHTQPPNHSP